MGNPATSEFESLRKVESGASFEAWRYRSSMLRLDYRRAGIVEVIVIGHGHVEFKQPCWRRWEEALRKNDRLTILADFWTMHGYDSGFRLGLTEWVAKHRNRMDLIHMLTRSQLVSMGAAVANLALGGAHQDPHAADQLRPRGPEARRSAQARRVEVTDQDAVGTRAVPGQREAVAALLDAQPATDAEREAVTWALGVLSAPIDGVVDLDPRFMPSNYQILMEMAFPVARAAGLIERYLGRDAQQSVGRMRRAGLVKL